MCLIEQIDKKRKEIKTDGYPMAISEWISMYESNELDIHPEFQRFYRWSLSQKTALIESILLGIPLPPIFVSQRSDGVWDVVDGLQRLSTIFQFLGILKDENGISIDPLVLQETKYLPALKGIQWDNGVDSKKSLPKDLQLVIKRSKLHASIILKESDETAKYELFQRLNTGGTELSAQEVRNCLLVMINKPFFDWLKSLSKNEAFISTTALSDRPLEEAYDVELALRFVLLAQVDVLDIKSIGDVSGFITEKMVQLAGGNKVKRTPIARAFKETFSILDNVLGDNAFKRFNPHKNKHEGGFLVSLYETIGLGVAFNIINDTLCAESQIIKRARSVWSDRKFTDWASAGVNSSRRLPRLIPYGRALFNK